MCVVQRLAALHGLHTGAGRLLWVRLWLTPHIVLQAGMTGWPAVVAVGALHECVCVCSCVWLYVCVAVLPGFAVIRTRSRPTVSVESTQTHATTPWSLEQLAHCASSMVAAAQGSEYMVSHNCTVVVYVQHHWKMRLPHVGLRLLWVGVGGWVGSTLLLCATLLTCVRIP